MVSPPGRSTLHRVVVAAALASCLATSPELGDPWNCAGGYLAGPHYTVNGSCVLDPCLEFEDVDCASVGCTDGYRYTQHGSTNYSRTPGCVTPCDALDDAACLYMKPEPGSTYVKRCGYELTGAFDASKAPIYYDLECSDVPDAGDPGYCLGAYLAGPTYADDELCVDDPCASEADCDAAAGCELMIAVGGSSSCSTVCADLDSNECEFLARDVYTGASRCLKRAVAVDARLLGQLRAPLLGRTEPREHSLLLG